MLLQSQNDELHLLPALPDQWPEGAVSGLKARGGYQVNLDWSEGKLKKAVVSSLYAGNCVVRSAQSVLVNGKVIKPRVTEFGYVISFPVTKGGIYTLKPGR